MVNCFIRASKSCGCHGLNVFVFLQRFSLWLERNLLLFFITFRLVVVLFSSFERVSIRSCFLIRWIVKLKCILDYPFRRVRKKPHTNFNLTGALISSPPCEERVSTFRLLFFGTSVDKQLFHFLLSGSRWICDEMNKDVYLPSNEFNCFHILTVKIKWHPPSFIIDINRDKPKWKFPNEYEFSWNFQINFGNINPKLESQKYNLLNHQLFK